MILGRDASGEVIEVGPGARDFPIGGLHSAESVPMASQTSFKQQCPSCEAMVPIKDSSLVGSKIDCPKCKYRFVVEDPGDVITDATAEEGPKSSKIRKADAKGDKAKGKKTRTDGDEADGKAKKEKAARAAAPAKPAREAPPAKVKRKRRFPYRKVEDLEADIAAAEMRLREVEALLASPELYKDGERVKDTTRAFEEVKQELQRLYEHWEEAVELN